MPKAKPLAISIGCPAGVGPLVAVQAAHQAKRVRCVLVGDDKVIERAADTLGVSQQLLRPLAAIEELSALRLGEIGVWQPSQKLRRAVAPGKPTAAAGMAQLSWIDEACALVQGGHCGALVTGPVSKEIIARGSSQQAKQFRGHTEHLARALGGMPVVMAFSSRRLTVSLATTHLPLAEVPRQLDEARVVRAISELAHYLLRLNGRAANIVVTGLNPHAGEGGLLGDEEIRIVSPAVQRARRQLQKSAPGTSLHGPLGAETAFRQAAAGEHDGVVAMYHDQATIACKLLGFGEMVNVTLGLPIVRVSVDHGTAYDAAARGSASAKGMLSAIRLGARLARS